MTSRCHWHVTLSTPAGLVIAANMGRRSAVDQAQVSAGDPRASCSSWRRHALTIGPGGKLQLVFSAALTLRRLGLRLRPPGLALGARCGADLRGFPDGIGQGEQVIDLLRRTGRFNRRTSQPRGGVTEAA